MSIAQKCAKPNFVGSRKKVVATIDAPLFVASRKRVRTNAPPRTRGITGLSHRQLFLLEAYLVPWNALQSAHEGLQLSKVWTPLSATGTGQ